MLPKPRQIKYHIEKLHHQRVVDLLIERILALTNVSGSKRNRALKLVTSFASDFLTLLKDKVIIEEHLQHLIRLGQALSANGYHEEALTYLQQLTEITSGHPYAMVEKANVLVALGKSDEAHKIYNDLISLKVVTLEAKRKYAEMCYSQGVSQNAITLYYKEIENNPDDNDLRLDCAEYLLKNNRLDESEDQCREILSRNPELGLAIKILAKIYFRRKQFSQLQSMYLKLVEKHPHRNIYKVKLANVYREMEHYSEARALYLEVLENYPDNCECLDGIADISFHYRDYDAAISYYTQALELQPERYIRWFRLARVYYKQMEYNFALTAIDMALGLEPDNISAMLLKSNILRKMKNYTETVRFSKRILQNFKLSMEDDSNLKNGMGFAMMELYKQSYDEMIYYEAERVLVEIAAINPTACCGLVFLYGERVMVGKIHDPKPYFQKMNQYIKMAESLDPKVKDLQRAKEVFSEAIVYE